MAFFGAPRVDSRRTPTHMTFIVGGCTYGIPLDMVSEVAAAADISPLPESGSSIAGQIDLHGAAIAVMDMGLRLQGRAVRRGRDNCVLVVKNDRGRSGCLFDAPGEMLSIPVGEAVFSGCLVEAATGVESVPSSGVADMETASRQGLVYGYPMYKSPRGVIYLPDRSQFYPQ